MKRKYSCLIIRFWIRISYAYLVNREVLCLIKYIGMSILYGPYETIFDKKHLEKDLIMNNEILFNIVKRISLWIAWINKRTSEGDFLVCSKEGIQTRLWWTEK